MRGKEAAKSHTDNERQGKASKRTVCRRLAHAKATSEGLGSASMAVNGELATTERHDGDRSRVVEERGLVYVLKSGLAYLECQRCSLDKMVLARLGSSWFRHADKR